MAIFSASDSCINPIKKKQSVIFILTIVISSTIWLGLTLFVFIVNNFDINLFFICLGIYIVITSPTVYFSLRFLFKLQAKEMKSVQYIIENDRLIIKQNNFERFNISKNEIKCINKYKNNVIIIILNENKKIIVNKYLDNYDQFIENLNILSPINRIDKNPSTIKNNFL
jgi:hypothetical protein